MNAVKMEIKEAVVMLLDYSIDDNTAVGNVLSAGLIADALNQSACVRNG